MNPRKHMNSWTDLQRKAFQIFHKQGRVCLHCGAFQVNDSLFCTDCESWLWKKHPEATDFFEPATGISGKCLFSWYPDQDRMISKLLLSLKQGKSLSSVDYYVEQFCSKLSTGGRLKNSVLVPCPSLQKWDHAQALACSFSRVLNLPVKEILRKKADLGPQKSLGKVQRIRLEMSATEKNAIQHVIFIDDILTTGATAAAARRALGLKQSFEVWCLGRRRLPTQSMTMP